MRHLWTKKIKLNFAEAVLFTSFCMLLFVPLVGEDFGKPSTYYEVSIDDEYIGCVSDKAELESILLSARLDLAKQRKEMVLSDVIFKYDEKNTLFGTTISDEELYRMLYQYLENDTVDIQQAYMVKINTYTAYLNTIDDVNVLLDTVIEKYDPENEFQINIIADTDREINMYTAEAISSQTKVKEVETVGQNSDFYLARAGMTEDLLDYLIQEENTQEENTQKDDNQPVPEDTDDTKQPQEELPSANGKTDGLKSISFAEKVEISEAYVSKSLVITVDQAIEEVTKEQEKDEIYVVQAGDTLSEIANDHGLLVAELLALNEGFDSNVVLRVGDEVVITVPQPELSVVTTRQSTYEEEYQAEIQYIDNDEWYTTKSVIRQEAKSGYREVTALITDTNGTEQGRDVIAQTVISEAVPEIIEQGTQTPPTYIKPISGGRQSSGFGRRRAPTRGASTYHKGVDWATPTGTSVVASCGGTVAIAGWQSGYGYVVYINHPDGRQTRYGHLSKVLVSPGQTVKQGQKIALSGNTGRSTGPHLHFEILIGGSQVNPLKYIN